MRIPNYLFKEQGLFSSWIFKIEGDKEIKKEKDALQSRDFYVLNRKWINYVSMEGKFTPGVSFLCNFNNT